MHKETIIVSGIPPSKGGVGRFVASFSEYGKSFKFILIARREKKSIKNLYKRFKYFLIISEIFLRFYDALIFFYKTFYLRNKNIIFFHPQTAGFNLLFRLTKKNNVLLYLMDCSFFCIKSYNHNESTGQECLICLKNIDCIDESCTPFPVVNYSRTKNIAHLKKLKNISSNITFLAQNEMQLKLVQSYCEMPIDAVLAGWDTGELNEFVCKPDNKNLIEKKFTIIYHGNSVIAKGLRFFIELSKAIPEVEFIVPDTHSNVEMLLDQKINNSNLFFLPCTWESGLKELVESSSLVIVPSLWSAPVEGSLIKSIRYNGNVAVVESDYGFSNESGIRDVVLRLPIDIHEAKIILLSFISSKINMRDSSAKWLIEFNQSNNNNLIFEKIFKKLI